MEDIPARETGNHRRRMVVACRSGLASSLRDVVDGAVELMIFGVAGDVADLGGLLEAAEPDVVLIEATPGRPDVMARAASLQRRRPGVRVFVLSEVTADAPPTITIADSPDGRAGLTAREIQVLEQLAEGLDLKSISRSLGISLHTTRGHVKNLLTKLEAHSQLEAVVLATRRGYLRPTPVA